MAKKTTILLVDDDPDIREFVTYNLTKEGYHVVTAKDGAEGVEAVKKHRPDLVLLDVMMPGMDGIEACEAIRNNLDIAGTLIAFLSARGEDYSQVAGFDAGADDYITKPIRPKVLASRVKALLRRNVKDFDSVGSIEIANLIINPEKYQVFMDGIASPFGQQTRQGLVPRLHHGSGLGNRGHCRGTHHRRAHPQNPRKNRTRLHQDHQGCGLQI